MTTTPETASELALIERLQNTINDLDGYIDLRARELAAPLIDAAQVEADQRVAEAQNEARRWQDVTSELRRQIKALERRLDRERSKGEN